MAVSKEVLRASRYFFAATMVTSLDRSVMAPMMIGIAVYYQTSLSVIVAAASGYLLAYGFTQPLWGFWSERIGRIRTIQYSLLIGGIANLICFLPMSMWLFFSVRTIAGFGMAAAFPSAMIYFSDAVKDEKIRHPLITRLTAGVAIGLMGGTFFGGMFVEKFNWRAIFLIIGVISIYFAIAIRTIENNIPAVVHLSVPQTYKAIYNNVWAKRLYLLVMIEGFVLLGTFAMTVPSLEREINSASISGLVSSIYGISVLIMSILVAKVTKKWSTISLINIGGAASLTAYLLLAFKISLITVAISVFLQGIAWVFFHTTLQAWITSIQFEAKATAISLFAGFLFIGNATGTTFGGLALDNYGHVTLFMIAAIVGAIMWGAGFYYRRLYNREVEAR
ncbi:MAG: MFS transporter [Candidatus Planktophila sp.]